MTKLLFLDVSQGYERDTDLRESEGVIFAGALINTQFIYNQYWLINKRAIL